MSDEWGELPKPGSRARLAWGAHNRGALVTSVHLHEGRQMRVELSFDGWEEFRSDGAFERLTGLEELEILSAAPDFGSRAGLRPIPVVTNRPDSLRQVPGRPAPGTVVRRQPDEDRQRQ